MLFINLLDEKFQLLSPVFEKLFKLIMLKQTHPSDLLLVKENCSIVGKKDPQDENRVKYDYKFGPEMEGHSENTHIKFVANYILSASEEPFQQYLDSLIWSNERNDEVRLLQSQEAFTIQIEMLIYLKIWEGDTLIKVWYQLARLANREDFDWHFKIKGHDKRDTSGFPRSVILRDHVIAKFTEILPDLSNLMNKIYRPQIRNAIAHSQYVIIGSTISLLNHVKEDPKSIRTISFQEWTELFHTTIMFYRLYDKMLDRANDHYYDKAVLTRNKIEVRLQRKVPSFHMEHIILYTREYFKDWTPHFSKQ